ncbi:MAG: Asp-tRNA(Asn)/Glu-tRNA(Gln) amidotransferase subunit GatB [Candidatus Kinetoplastibacterium crithidii]|nr:Asp-tRNA(Asn)/Glu-tRNA(Gln) amidotransferase subunit GatB [Candidatus Kinetoplastibacterium crithidii]
MNSKWETTIGIETHVQLLTKTKIFSSSYCSFGAKPNQNTNEIDIALPGSLPVANIEAIKCAIKFGLAVNAKISCDSRFDRKHYFYPDLPKGYQTSQFHKPILQGGKICFYENNIKKTINLVEAHLEEDAGKLIHQSFSTGIDLNRAGMPLLEIVTHPEICSAQEAVAYAKTLHNLVTWLGICDGNMQEGSFRCDANVSVKLKNSKELGTRTEIKNINSFKFLEKAILFESKRQINLLEQDKLITQETRLYDSDKNETRSMRNKENAIDYRYMPDPDLPVIYITTELIEATRKSLPELPETKRTRFEKEYNLSKSDASQLSSNINIANYFESILSQLPKGSEKIVANWMIGDLNSFMNKHNKTIEEIPVEAKTIAAMIEKIINGTLSNKNAKDVFEILWNNEQSNIDEIIEKNGLKQINDDSVIIDIINSILTNNRNIVEDYKSGKEKAFNSLIGKIMKESKGRANPSQIRELLQQQLCKIN